MSLHFESLYSADTSIVHLHFTESIFHCVIQQKGFLKGRNVQCKVVALFFYFHF